MHCTRTVSRQLHGSALSCEQERHEQLLVAYKAGPDQWIVFPSPRNCSASSFFPLPLSFCLFLTRPRATLPVHSASPISICSNSKATPSRSGNRQIADSSKLWGGNDEDLKLTPQVSMHEVREFLLTMRQPAPYSDSSLILPAAYLIGLGPHHIIQRSSFRRGLIGKPAASASSFAANLQGESPFRQ